MRNKLIVLSRFFVLFQAFPMTSMALNACNELSTSEAVKKISYPTSQIVVVNSLGGIRASVLLCQREGRHWTSAFPSSFRAVIGKNGIASLGKKNEGDLKTPAGLYVIGEAFGTKPLALKMDYKYITKEDKFIDDVNSAHYNSWVFGTTDAARYESMLIKPYVYGAVIKYNMNPTKKGAGSALFMHVWHSPNSPTAGCVALRKGDVLKILHWLDKAQYPYILIH